MEPFSNSDDATEVLSRLPFKSLLAFKCTSKRWNDFISDSSFLRLHSQRSKGFSGMCVQGTRDCWDIGKIYYIHIDTEPCVVQDNFLDFLPERVVLLNSCNGILCCRSCTHDIAAKRERFPLSESDCSKHEVVIYICNPIEKEWVALRPDGLHVGEAFGLAFYPFGSSSTMVPSFRLVGLERSKKDPNNYSFVTYSSETQRWTTSQQVCNLNSKFYWDKMIFVNGRFHWLTWNHHVITFDVERELAQVLKLPGITPYERDNCRVGIGLGNSEGYFHYVCAFKFDVKIWILKDYSQPDWVLKHNLPLIEFCEDHSGIFNTDGLLRYMRTDHPEECTNIRLEPLAFEDEVLFMRASHNILSYNFKTGRLVNHCNTWQLGNINFFCTLLPYTFSLTSLRKFKGAGVRAITDAGAAISGSLNENSGGRTPKKRKPTC